jgi:flagellar biosynthesis/type III secretory pathway protein FliH
MAGSIPIVDGEQANWREILGALRVLQKEQYESWITAEGILAKAEAEKQRLLADAQTQVKTIKDSAYTTGLEEGRRAGKEALDKISGKWAEVLKQFEERLQTLLRGESELIVAYATLLAERVLQTQLADPRIFQEYLLSLLNEDSGKTCRAVFVNPLKVNEVVAAKKHLSALAKAEIFPDPKLGLADVHLRFDNHRVDGRVPTLVGAASAILLEQVLKEEKGA